MVRTALLSDVHGNAVALQAVVDVLDAECIEDVVCLGDMIQGGPQPRECVALLRRRGWPVVLGNADAFMLDPAAAEGSDEPITERQLATRDWSMAQLSADDALFVAGFAPTVEADLGSGRRLLACHAVPSSYDPLVFPTTPEQEFRELVGDVDADVVAGGHIHLQYIRRMGATLFVNPGSVGLSYDHEQDEDDDGFRVDPWAAYAVVSTDGDRFGVELRREPVDTGAVRRVILESGIPYARDHLRSWTPRPAAR